MSEVTPSVTGAPRDGAHIILGSGSVSRQPQVPWEFSLSLPQPDLPGATGQDWEPAKAELTVDESGWRKSSDQNSAALIRQGPTAGQH